MAKTARLAQQRTSALDEHRQARRGMSEAVFRSQVAPHRLPSHRQSASAGRWPAGRKCCPSCASADVLDLPGSAAGHRHAPCGLAFPAGSPARGLHAADMQCSARPQRTARSHEQCRRRSITLMRSMMSCGIGIGSLVHPSAALAVRRHLSPQPSWLAAACSAAWLVMSACA